MNDAIEDSIVYVYFMLYWLKRTALAVFFFFLVNLKTQE